jgi:hypothetical protein
MYVLVKTVMNNESWWDTVLFPKIKGIRTKVNTIPFNMTVPLSLIAAENFYITIKIMFNVINTKMKCIKCTSGGESILISGNIFRYKVRNNYEGQSCVENQNKSHFCLYLSLSLYHQLSIIALVINLFYYCWYLAARFQKQLQKYETSKIRTLIIQISHIT